MPKTVIYHNPRCSKSRATLELLQQKQADIAVVKYLDNPPSQSAIKVLLKELNSDIRSILRKTEAEYKEHGFADETLSETELIERLSQFPKVMERPIVSYSGQAAIGRPPENVLRLFND